MPSIFAEIVSIAKYNYEIVHKALKQYISFLKIKLILIVAIMVTLYFDLNFVISNKAKQRLNLVFFFFSFFFTYSVKHFCSCLSVSRCVKVERFGNGSCPVFKDILETDFLESAQVLNPMVQLLS